MHASTIFPGPPQEILKRKYTLSKAVQYVPGVTSLVSKSLNNQQVIHAQPGGIVRKQLLEEIPFDALYATRFIDTLAE